MLTPEKKKERSYPRFWPGVKGCLRTFYWHCTPSYLLVRYWVFPEGLSFQARSQGDNLRRRPAMRSSVTGEMHPKGSVELMFLSGPCLVVLAGTIRHLLPWYAAFQEAPNNGTNQSYNKTSKSNLSQEKLSRWSNSSAVPSTKKVNNLWELIFAGTLE